MRVVHIASISLTKETGMGRIAWNWRKAFEEAGHEFIHIGNQECPKKYHHLLWGKQVSTYMKKSRIKADLILVHEPASGYFVGNGVPVVLFSHGVETRGWEMEGKYHYRNETWKSFFLPESIRYRANAIGLKRSGMLLLSNQEDKTYVMDKFKRKESDITIFKNGYYAEHIPHRKGRRDGGVTNFLFNASWLDRKGKGMMIAAFDEVYETHPKGWKLILAGVGDQKDAIMQEFPVRLRDHVEIVCSFSQLEETKLYERSDAFILPSYFEGQSLALTQAMASGLCCICSDNCGQKDFIKHGENGLLFKTGNVGDLAKQIKWVLEMPSAMDYYAENAQELVKDYTWDRVSREIVQVCEATMMSGK